MGNFVGVKFSKTGRVFRVFKYKSRTVDVFYTVKPFNIDNLIFMFERSFDNG